MANPTASLPGSRTIILPREPRRGLFGHFLAVLLQPVAFFRQMPTTRQWVGAAIIILVLVGAAEVRRTSLSEDSGGVTDLPFDPTVGVPTLPDGVPGGGIQLEPPIPVGIIPGETSTGSSITETTVTLLVAASGVVLAWMLQSIVLSPVPMFNAAPPSFARNIQVAVWASVPLGLLALIQLIYYSLGGEVGSIGVSILLERWEGYESLSPFAQALLHSLALHMTLFWLWSLILLFIGARRALGGRWWVAALILAIWVAFVILLPVLTGAIQPLEMSSTGDEFGTAGDASLLTEEFPVERPGSPQVPGGNAP